MDPSLEARGTQEQKQTDTTKKQDEYKLVAKEDDENWRGSKFGSFSSVEGRRRTGSWDPTVMGSSGSGFGATRGGRHEELREKREFRGGRKCVESSGRGPAVSVPEAMLKALRGVGEGDDSCIKTTKRARRAIDGPDSIRIQSEEGTIESFNEKMSSTRLGNEVQVASFGGHEEMVKLLLDKSADANAQGGKYGSALLAASTGGHKEIVKLLLDKGADVNAQGGEYGNALQAASRGGHEEIVKLLLDKGADVNAQGGEYGNALQTASFGGHEEIVKLLLDTGAEINAQGGKYGSALQAASRGGHEEIVKLLLDKGADVNAQGGEYGNALQAASFGGHEEIVKLLLDNGADVDVDEGAGNEYDSVHMADVETLDGRSDLPEKMLQAVARLGDHLPGSPASRLTATIPESTQTIHDWYIEEEEAGSQDLLSTHRRRRIQDSSCSEDDYVSQRRYVRRRGDWSDDEHEEDHQYRRTSSRRRRSRSAKSSGHKRPVAKGTSIKDTAPPPSSTDILPSALPRYQRFASTQSPLTPRLKSLGPEESEDTPGRTTEHNFERQSASPATASDYVMVPSSPLLIEDNASPSGIDIADSSNIRQRQGGRRNRSGPAPAEGGQRAPEEDKDIELGGLSSRRGQSRGRARTSTQSAGRRRGDPGDNSPSPGPESFDSLPRRSHPCLGIATLLCIILGVLSFAILAIAFKDSFIAEHSAQDSIHNCMSRCQKGSRPRMANTIGDLSSPITPSPANDPQFYFSIQSSGWLTLGVISALIPAFKHAQRHGKWTRMCYVWIPGVLSLLLGILSPWVFLKSQAVSNGLGGLAGAMQAMVIYYATYEVFVEEKAEKISAGRLQRRGRRSLDN